MESRRVRSKNVETGAGNQRTNGKRSINTTHINPQAVFKEQIHPGAFTETEIGPRSIREKHLHPELLPWGGGGSMRVVAAADTSDRNKARADYVCDGTDDHVEIQEALDEVGIGGTVYLIGSLFLLGDTVLFGDSRRLGGTSVRNPVIATTFNGPAFRIVHGCGIERMLIDTAGYSAGSSNTGVAVEGDVLTVGTHWWYALKVETVTTGQPGFLIDNRGTERNGNIWLSDCPVFRTEPNTYGIEIYNARHVFIRDCQGHNTSGGTGPDTNTGIYIDSDTVNVDIIGGDWIGNIDVHCDAARVIGIDGSLAGKVRLQAASRNSIVMGCMRMHTVSDAGTGNQLANNNVGGAPTDVKTAPATTVVSETGYGQAAAVGSSTTTHARSDHTHGTPALPTPAAIGAATDDHTHAAESSGELLVADGVSPIEALTTEAGDDWLYEG